MYVAERTIEGQINHNLPDVLLGHDGDPLVRGHQVVQAEVGRKVRRRWRTREHGQKCNNNPISILYLNYFSPDSRANFICCLSG